MRDGLCTFDMSVRYKTTSTTNLYEKSGKRIQSRGSNFGPGMYLHLRYYSAGPRSF